MAKTYDLVIIGTGTVAMVASSRLAAAGWKLAVIDYRPFGGTCALRGCDPKKVLVGSAEVIDSVRRMKGHGIAADRAEINWAELIAFKRTFIDPVPESQEEQYAEMGVDTFHGQARFIGHHAIDVAGERLEARYFLIATGARPAPLGFPGEEHLIDNERFLELEELPRRITMVGGGYIAAEFSHIGARAGASVTVLQRGGRMLTRFDPDLVDWLMDKFWAIGIDVRIGTTVEAVEKRGQDFIVRARSKNGPQTIEADLVVHAAGRIPDLDGLDLEAAGVERQGSRLKLNEFLQSTSNLAVYAAGDAANVGPPLTPVSSHDAKVVAANLLEGNKRRPNYLGVPSVAFTVPPIAAVGLGEKEAREQNLKFRKRCEKASDWYTAHRVAETVYGFKVLVEEETDRILGAHLVGPHVDEVINVFAFAIRHGVIARDVQSTIFVYPTGASDIGYML